MKRLAFSLLAACCLFSAAAAQTFLDLSKTANLGPDTSFDEAVTGIQDLKQKNGLLELPVGRQVFRGVPFQILDPAKNQGRSLVVLKGRRKPNFPEGVSIPAGHLKAVSLYFLHTCRWGGTAPNITVAEYDIVYEDGQVTAIPLRVGVEFTNFFGADDTSASYLGWWYKYKNAGMGLNFFPWKNPRPDKAIDSILFKSRGSMPVPILLAITGVDKEVPISPDSPKPEKTFQTDTSKWIPFQPSNDSPAGTAIDMSFLLDAPAGKRGKVKADGDKLIFEDGTPARFWGVKLGWDWPSLTPEKLSGLAGRLASSGCNLVILEGPTVQWQALPSNLKTCLDVFKAKGIYAVFAGDEKLLSQTLLDDPAILSQSLWSGGLIHRNDPPQNVLGSLRFTDTPMVLNPETSIPFYLSFRRPLGVPYRAEWVNGWPNEYLGEAPLLTASYACFGDWTACVGMSLSGEPFGGEIKTDLDILNKPVMSSQWPVGALAYLRGDLKEGKLFVLENRDDSPDLTTSLKVLAHRSGMRGGAEKLKTDVSGELKAKIISKTKSFVSDSGQITWQGNVGVVKVEAPRFQALIGFLGHRKFNNPYWAVETPNEFASISAISLVKKPLNTSEHLLVTGVTRMENTGQVYNAAKTKLLSAGTAPILVEPLSAKIVLYRFAKDAKLKVRALDANGQLIKAKVPAKWVKNNLVISWIPSAFYLELYK